VQLSRRLDIHRLAVREEEEVVRRPSKRRNFHRRNFPRRNENRRKLQRASKRNHLPKQVSRRRWLTRVAYLKFFRDAFLRSRGSEIEEQSTNKSDASCKKEEKKGEKNIRKYMGWLLHFAIEYPKFLRQSFETTTSMPFFGAPRGLEWPSASTIPSQSRVISFLRMKRNYFVPVPSSQSFLSSSGTNDVYALRAFI